MPGDRLAQARDVGARLGAGHLQVEHEDVGAAVLDQLRRARRVGGLADHPQVVLGFEHRPQPDPDHVVVVGEDDGDLTRGAHVSQSAGRRRAPARRARCAPAGPRRPVRARGRAGPGRGRPARTRSETLPSRTRPPSRVAGPRAEDQEVRVERRGRRGPGREFLRAARVRPRARGRRPRRRRGGGRGDRARAGRPGGVLLGVGGALGHRDDAKTGVMDRRPAGAAIRSAAAASRLPSTPTSIRRISRSSRSANPPGAIATGQLAPSTRSRPAESSASRAGRAPAAEPIAIRSAPSALPVASAEGLSSRARAAASRHAAGSSPGTKTWRKTCGGAPSSSSSRSSVSGT